MAREIDGWAGALELDDQPAARRTVQQPVEGRLRPADAAPDRNRQQSERVCEVRTKLAREITRKLRDRLSQQLAGDAEEGFRIGADLNDHQIRLAQQKQRAARLDRACEMDLLQLAIGQIGPPEGRRYVQLPDLFVIIEGQWPISRLVRRSVAGRHILDAGGAQSPAIISLTLAALSRRPSYP